jgi:hypothetical protein
VAGSARPLSKKLAVRYRPVAPTPARRDTSRVFLIVALCTFAGLWGGIEWVTHRPRPIEQMVPVVHKPRRAHVPAPGAAPQRAYRPGERVPG